MVKEREGYHSWLVQIPEAAWRRIRADAARRGESATRVLTRLLVRHYRIPAGELPPPKPAGRKPKK